MKNKLHGHRALVLAVGAALLMSSGAHAASPLSPWVGTWGVANKDMGAFDPTDDFKGQTFRHIVHTSIGGTSARVTFSNSYGDQPLSLSDIKLAQSAGGSSSIPGTQRSVTFNGNNVVVIAPGEEVTSDSIDAPVPALSDLTISFFLPEGAAGEVTGHDRSGQTLYIADGDVAGDADINAWASQGYFFLSGVSVKGGEPSTGAIVAIGASITNGDVSTFNKNVRWSNDLAARLQAAGRNVGVINEGISGNSTLVDTVAGVSVLNRFSHDVIAQAAGSGARWVIFSDTPLNDLANDPSTGSAPLIAAAKQMIEQAHRHHMKFLCSTLTPFGGSVDSTPTAEKARSDYNAFVRTSNNGCDGIVDQDAAVHDPIRPTKYLAKYDSGDHIHPNDAGHQALANSVDLSLFEAPAVRAIVAPASPCGMLLPGEGFSVGQSLRSCANGHHLDLQQDANLVLYDTQGASTWVAWTYDEGSREVTLDPDGNLLVYSSIGTQIWSSQTPGHPMAWMVLQDDGNLILKDVNGPYFQTGAAGH
jgi:lysophospholipase L1-like esterase